VAGLRAEVVVEGGLLVVFGFCVGALGVVAGCVEDLDEAPAVEQSRRNTGGGRAGKFGAGVLSSLGVPSGIPQLAQEIANSTARHLPEYKTEAEAIGLEGLGPVCHKPPPRN